MLALVPFLSLALACSTGSSVSEEVEEYFQVFADSSDEDSNPAPKHASQYHGVAVTAAGTLVVAGSAFPPVGRPYGFVATLEGERDTIGFARLVGGATSAALDVAVGRDGSVVVVGTTCDSRFAATTPRANDRAQRSEGDAFAIVFSSDLKCVMAAYVFGGVGSDLATSIAADPERGFWIGGLTTSSDFPRVDRSKPGERVIPSAFLMRLDTDGLAEVARMPTGIGGIVSVATGDEFVALSAAIDEVHSTELECSRVGPGGKRDVFVACFDHSGTRRSLTILGGREDDGLPEDLIHSSPFVFLDQMANHGMAGGGLAVASDSSIAVVFATGSNELIASPGTFGTAVPSPTIRGHAFLAVLNRDGSLRCATHVASRDTDDPAALAYATNGDLLVGGRTFDQGLLGLEGEPLNYDGFLLRVNADLTSVIARFGFTGVGTEWIDAVLEAPDGRIVAAGGSYTKDRTLAVSDGVPAGPILGERGWYAIAHRFGD